MSGVKPRDTWPISDGRTLQLWLVAWCPVDKWLLPDNEVGTPCPGDECERTLLKRLRWVCSRCGFSWPRSLMYDTPEWRAQAIQHDCSETRT